MYAPLLLPHTHIWKKVPHSPHFGTMFAKMVAWNILHFVEQNFLKTMANPLLEMMAETMATSALTGIMGTDATALNPMMSALSKMDEKQMATAISTLTPIVGMLSQMTKK